MGVLGWAWPLGGGGRGQAAVAEAVAAAEAPLAGGRKEGNRKGIGTRGKGRKEEPSSSCSSS